MRNRFIIIAGMAVALWGGLRAQQPGGQTRLAQEERTRFVEDSLLAARLNDTIALLRDSLRYVIENYVPNTDSRLSDSRTPTGNAGGDLTGTYPNPTIKSSVTLKGNPTVQNNLRIGNMAAGVQSRFLYFCDSSNIYLRGYSFANMRNLYLHADKIYLQATSSVTAPTPASTDNSTKVATTAYVKSNLADYVPTDDSRLSDSRTPTGTAGGDLTGSYPNPTIKSSVALTGSPTAPTPPTTAGNTRIATTAYVKNNLTNYVPTTDSRLSDSRTPKGSAGGDLTGSYPNPTIKESVTLTGNPTVTGNLRLKGSGNYGNKLNLGDNDYVYLSEPVDDILEIHTKSVRFTGMGTASENPLPLNQGGTGATTAAAARTNLGIDLDDINKRFAHMPYLVAGGHVAADGALSLPAGYIGSVTKTSTGTYRFSQIVGQTNNIFIPIPTTSGVTASIGAKASGGVTVYTRNQSGTLVDCAFDFIVLAFKYDSYFGW